MIDGIRPNCSEDRHSRSDWQELVDQAAVFAQDGAIKGFAVAIGIAGYNDEVEIMAAGPPADRERLLVAIVTKELGPVRIELHNPAADVDPGGLIQSLGTTSDKLRRYLATVDRECRMRQRVYPRWVESGKMSQKNADKELQAMAEVGDLIQSIMSLCKVGQSDQPSLEESAA